MSVYRSPRGRWMVDVVIEHADGRVERVRKVSPGATKRDAETYERELRSALVAGTHGREGCPTLAAFAARFLAYQASINRPSETRAKAAIVRDHLLPTFGETPLDRIDPAAVDDYTAGKLASGLAPNTVANHVTVIKRVLAMAVTWGVVAAAPKIKQLRRPQTEFDFLDADERDRFVDAAGDWRLFAQVAVYTGMRLGELRGVQWGDLDLDRRRVRVARAYTKDGWSLPKSGKARTIDLCEDLASAMRAAKPARAARDALVLPGVDGAPLDEKRCASACSQIAADAGIARGVHPHMLRHTFASLHAMAGTPLPVLQSWMGHADISTTMRYAHLGPSTGAAFADAINRSSR